ncbi:sensor histidine kinase [Plantactinospora sp. KLBMP9567]|uniref:sensor histidine kinase n=1 Tax=Plantactinospora sp. KLBMP9567 TaxID=3085900 RepID=UPI00298127C6|nr:histidine kinase [Plantactinospora sp. KLBMP9567]MDW5329742.1 histidine kinase [Plantactinospora sp. KLBMP9567]
MTGVAARPEHPWLLPATLTADPATGRPRPRRSTRDWIVDTICFLIASGYAFIAFWDVLSPRPTLVADRADSELAVAIDSVLTTALCLALWVRRRWPVALAAAALPVALFSTPSGIATLIILLTLVVHRPLSVAGPLVAAHLGVAVLYEYRNPDPTDGPWIGMALSGVLTASVLAWGMFIRARRQLVLSWRDRAYRAEAEQRLRVEAARRLERTRIAGEMHDVLAHRISLLSLHAGALEFRPDAPPEEIARAAGVIRTSAHQALQDLREVISVLREDPPEGGAEQEQAVEPTPLSDGWGAAPKAYPPDPPYPPVPLPAAGEPDPPVPPARTPERPQPTLDDLPALVAESREAGMRVDLRTELTATETAPAGLGRGAYRIVQEGLTNARKHAPGTSVLVTARGRPGLGLSVEVRNRWPVGQPAGPRIPGTGTGLVGLGERTALLGGWLEHGRTDSGDFRLAAWLPWPS